MAREEANTWIGSESQEGALRTVRTLEGSVWRSATLIHEWTLGDEASSHESDDLFGLIGGIALGNGRIYVLDTQRPAVIVFDESGTETHRFGRTGQGPGEFQRPILLGVDPGRRLFVQDLARLNVLETSGNPLDIWPYPGGLLGSITVTADRTVFIPKPVRTDAGPVPGLTGLAPDGTVVSELTGPRFEVDRWELVARGPSGRSRRQLVPHTPRPVWSVLPSGRVATAISDEYSVRVSASETEPATAIEYATRLVELPRAERDWQRNQVVTQMREIDSSWQWNANPIPDHGPAFDAVFGDRHGRLWLARTVTYLEGTADDCGWTQGTAEPTPAPCWVRERVLDAFDVGSGRLLGSVALPAEAKTTPAPAFGQNALYFVAEDSLGQVLVRKYRLSIEEGVG